MSEIHLKRVFVYEGTWLYTENVLSLPFVYSYLILYNWCVYVYVAVSWMVPALKWDDIRW